MLITLDPRRSGKDRSHGPSMTYPWSRSKPFVINPRAVLVHRIRAARTVTWDERVSHHSLELWCGGSFNIDLEIVAAALVDDIPSDRILCERCETAAKEAGQPSADSILGRHAHIGRVRAFRTCCKTCCEDETN